MPNENSKLANILGKTECELSSKMYFSIQKMSFSSMISIQDRIARAYLKHAYCRCKKNTSLDSFGSGLWSQPPVIQVYITLEMKEEKEHRVPLIRSPQATIGTETMPWISNASILCQLFQSELKERVFGVSFRVSHALAICLQGICFFFLLCVFALRDNNTLVVPGSQQYK